MDPIIELVDAFSRMPLEKAALLLLFMALLLLGGLMWLTSRRDKNDSESDKGLMESVRVLANTVQKLAESLPVFVDAVRVLQNTMQQQEVLNQTRFETSRTVMNEVGIRRDAQFDSIETKLGAIPADVEAGMEPKLKEVVDTVTVLLDKFQEKLLRQIADLPVVVSTVIENAVADLPKAMIERLEAAIKKTKEDILAEIRADMVTPEPQTAPEGTETNAPKSEEPPAGEVANEVNDGSSV